MGKKVQKIDPSTKMRYFGLIELDELDTEVTDEFLKSAGNEFAGFSLITADADDIILVEDDSDSNNKKKITIQGILDLVPAGLPTGTGSNTPLAWISADSEWQEIDGIQLVDGRVNITNTVSTSPALDIEKTTSGTAVVIDHTGSNAILALKSSAGEIYTFHANYLTIKKTVELSNQTGIKFFEQLANGSSYVKLQAPASLAGNTTYTLPATDGTSGQVLSTNGSGVLSWIDN